LTVFITTTMSSYFNCVREGSGGTRGGTTLRITGTSFDAFVEGEVTVGGEPCIVTAYGHTLIVCQSPPGIGTNLVVEVSSHTHDWKRSLALRRAVSHFCVFRMVSVGFGERVRYYYNLFILRFVFLVLGVGVKEWRYWCALPGDDTKCANGWCPSIFV